MKQYGSDGPTPSAANMSRFTVRISITSMLVWKGLCWRFQRYVRVRITMGFFMVRTPYPPRLVLPILWAAVGLPGGQKTTSWNQSTLGDGRSRILSSQSESFDRINMPGNGYVRSTNWSCLPKCLALKVDDYVRKFLWSLSAVASRFAEYCNFEHLNVWRAFRRTQSYIGIYISTSTEMVILREMTCPSTYHGSRRRSPGI